MVQEKGRANVPRMTNQPSSRARFKSRFNLRVFLATLLCASWGLLAACDRNIEPYQPGEQPSPPDLAQIFPGPTEDIGSEQAATANSRAPDRSALPPSRTEASADPASVVAAAIQGRIELPAELALSRSDTGVLFVIARPQGVQGGPPLAVLRIANPEFPVEFSIGPQNVMIPSMRFEGAISLSARLDEDGNAMTRGSGDISSRVEEPLSPGTTGVKLLLTERG